MANIPVAEARARLKSHFAEFGGDKYGEGWDKLWEKGDFLPWDRGLPSPALVEALQRRDIVGTSTIEVDGKPRRKRALIPGCGRGVDVDCMSWLVPPWVDRIDQR